jgi:RNA polymerase sigma-70 factor (ECF subfamily)
MYQGSELAAPVDFRSELTAILPRLRRFGLGLSGSITTADEMAKDACEVAMGRAAELEATDKFDSWMFGILHKVWQARSAANGELGQVSGLSDFFGPQAEKDRPVLDKLILGLPEEQRQVLMMVSIEGMSYRNTADVLGLPVGEVMQLASIARLSLVSSIATADETAP